jgi:cysteine desulfurase/selenocysteine lyase
MAALTTTPVLDPELIRVDFPILHQAPRGGHPLTFLDSAASSQKPQAVIDALSGYYSTTNANIHRGVYDLSERATNAYEAVRKQTAAFINATSQREIVFVRNTTEAINLVAQSWGRANLKPSDLIAFTAMEHHSNIVPWQLIAEQASAEIAYVGITPEGRLDLDSFDAVLARHPKLVAVTHVSNALGTINPVKDLIAKAHAAGALVLIDGAQSVPHMAMDVQDLDCDFLAFSGHKMLGPMGIGVLYGKKHLLEAMPPYMGGGSMIRKVTLEKTTWADVPGKFEAGTPSVGDVVAFGEALSYLAALGMDRVHDFEVGMTDYLLEQLATVNGLNVVGPATNTDRSAVISFTLNDVHPHDVAAILDEDNVAVRAGHHCAQPLLHALGVHSTTRASIYVYNTHEDIDRLVASLDRAYKIFH